jgi:hypothetical protein
MRTMVVAPFRDSIWRAAPAPWPWFHCLISFEGPLRRCNSIVRAWYPGLAFLKYVPILCASW